MKSGHQWKKNVDHLRKMKADRLWKKKVDRLRKMKASHLRKKVELQKKQASSSPFSFLSRTVFWFLSKLPLETEGRRLL